MKDADDEVIPKRCARVQSPAMKGVRERYREETQVLNQISGMSSSRWPMCLNRVGLLPNFI